MAEGRLILVACTEDMRGVLDYTFPAIRAYADKCNAALEFLRGDAGQWQHGKYRIFEAGQYNYDNIDRVLIMDCDVKPKADAPDIFNAHPTGNWMLNETVVFPHHIDTHKREVSRYFAEAGEADVIPWQDGVWWNPGVALLDVDAVRIVYRMPPWDVREKLFSIGPRKAVKNMPVINANIARSGLDIRPLDVRWNTFSTASKERVSQAHFIHYVCQQGVPQRNQIKAEMLSGQRRRVHFVCANVNPPWILERMQSHIMRAYGDAVQITTSNTPADYPGVINYYNPYRTFLRKSRHALDVPFFTHPEMRVTWDRARDNADHCVVMCEQYRRLLIDEGVPTNKVTLIAPGVDERYRDVRLRIFNPCKMPPGTYGERKGKSLWQALCDVPWLNCVLSNGTMTDEEVHLQYLACDAVVSTAVPMHGGEGGPMSCREGLSLGQHCVMPAGIGFIDEHADNPLLTRYEAGNLDALLKALSTLYHAKVNRCQPMADYTWERYAQEHVGLFARLFESMPALPREISPAQVHAGTPPLMRPSRGHVVLYFGRSAPATRDVIQFLRDKGYTLEVVDSPQGALDASDLLDKPLFERNRIISQRLGAIA